VTGPQGYVQLADGLRDQILSGQRRPGERLPSEADLMQTYGLARETVRRAVRVLQDEGLINVRHGYGTTVAQPPERTELPAEPGALVYARPATAAERSEYDLPPGWPMLVIRADGIEYAYPANQYAVKMPDVDMD
jgi:GntR family transcriptional regulator